MSNEDLELRTEGSVFEYIDGIWMKDGESIGPACYVSERGLEEIKKQHQSWLTAMKGTKGAAERYQGYLVKLLESANSSGFSYNRPKGRVVYIGTRMVDGKEKVELKASGIIEHYSRKSKEIGGELPRAEPILGTPGTPPELPEKPYVEPGGPNDDNFELTVDEPDIEKPDPGDSSAALEFLKEE